MLRHERPRNLGEAARFPAGLRFHRRQLSASHADLGHGGVLIAGAAAAEAGAGKTATGGAAAVDDGGLLRERQQQGGESGSGKGGTRSGRGSGRNAQRQRQERRLLTHGAGRAPRRVLEDVVGGVGLRLRVDGAQVRVADGGLVHTGAV